MYKPCSLIALLYVTLWTTVTGSVVIDYQDYLWRLFNASARQNAGAKDAFILECFFIPYASNAPGMTPWLYSDPRYPHNNPNTTGRPNVLIAWRPMVYSLNYIVMTSGPSKKDWQIIKPLDAIMRQPALDNSQQNTFYLAADPRLFPSPPSASIPQSSATSSANQMASRFIYSCQFHGVHCKMCYSDLHYIYKDVQGKGPQDALVVVPPIHHLKPPLDCNTTDCNPHWPQKNWSPFYYTPPQGRAVLLYIYSVNPHRILHGSIDGSISSVGNITAAAAQGIERSGRWGWDVLSEPVRTVAMTEFVPQNESDGSLKDPVWIWGQMRGGSPPILVPTPFGEKFITFFHSSGWFLSKALRTYFMGAYLFSPLPPFAITHISREPITPMVGKESFYSYNFSTGQSGFSNRKLDYCIFPVGAVLLPADDVVAVSLGRNEAQGLILLLNISLGSAFFLDHLKKVDTTVILDDAL